MEELRVEDLTSLEAEFEDTLIGLEQSDRHLRLKLQQEEDRNFHNQRLNATLLHQMQSQSQSQNRTQAVRHKKSGASNAEFSRSLLHQIDQIQHDIDELHPAKSKSKSKKSKTRRKRMSSTSSQVEEMERKLAESEKDFFEWVKWRRSSAVENADKRQPQILPEENNFRIVKRLNDAMEKVLHAREQNTMEEARQQCLDEINDSLARLLTTIQPVDESPQGLEAMKQSVYDKVNEICKRASGGGAVEGNPQSILEETEDKVLNTREQLIELNEQQEDKILQELKDSLSTGANEAVNELQVHLTEELNQKKAKLRQELEDEKGRKLDAVKAQLNQEHEKELEAVTLELQRSFEIEKAKFIHSMKAQFAKSLHRLTAEAEARRKTELRDLRKQLEMENEGKLEDIATSLQRDLNTAKSGIICQAQAERYRESLRFECTAAETFVLQEVEAKNEEKS